MALAVHLGCLESFDQIPDDIGIMHTVVDLWKGQGVRYVVPIRTSVDDESNTGQLRAIHTVPITCVVRQWQR